MSCATIVECFKVTRRRHITPQSKSKVLILNRTEYTFYLLTNMLAYYFFLVRCRRTRRKPQAIARKRFYIPRMSLLPSESSPWRHLYQSGSDSALVVVSGFDHNAFDFLLEKFQPVFNLYTPYTEDGFIRLKTSNRGRKRGMKAADCMGLVLLWCRTK